MKLKNILGLFLILVVAIQPVSAFWWLQVYDNEGTQDLGVIQNWAEDDGILNDYTYSEIQELNELQDETNKLFYEEHYTINYISRYTHFYTLEKKDNDILVSFGYDLNNMNGFLSSDNYIDDEYYTFNNYIRPSTSDITKIEYEATSDQNIYSNDYFGMPFEIISCFIDCDTSDNIAPVRWYMDSFSPDGDIWYMDINSYSGADSNWINQRFPIDNQFWDKNSVYRFQYNDFVCNYNTGGEKNIKLGCVLEKNPLYRDNSADDDTWSFNDIVSEFGVTSDSVSSQVVKTTINVDVDVLNYTSQTQSVSGTDTGDSSNPPNSKQLISQKEYIQLQQITKSTNNWQKIILNIQGFVFSFFLILYYIISLVSILTIMIGIFPFLFKKYNENIRELGRIKVSKGD
jgi:hypothetical protein